MKATMFVSLLLVSFITGCGSRHTDADLTDRAVNDPALAQLKLIFSTAKPITNTAETLALLKLDRSRTCLLMEATQGSLSSSYLTQKLTRFAGLLKSDMTFEETYQIQTIMKFGEKDLFTQVSSAVSRPLAQPANVYMRRTDDGRLAEEWAIQSDELLKVPSTKRGTSLVRANLLLDAAIAEPTRRALFYVLCE